MKSINVAQIFYLSLCSGIACTFGMMYILNGLLEYGNQAECLIVGSIVLSIGIWATRKTINILQPAWKNRINLS